MYSYLLSDCMYMRVGDSAIVNGMYQPMRIIRSAAQPLETPYNRSLAQFLNDSAIPYHFEYIENTTPATYLTGVNAGTDSSTQAVTAIVILHLYSENDAFQIRMFNGFEPLAQNWREIFQGMGKNNVHNDQVFKRLSGKI